MLIKCITGLVLAIFFFNSIGPIPGASAQVAFLPAPGTMVNFSPKFNQAILKGLVLHPDNPLKLDFILDEGDANLNVKQVKSQSQKIAMYFLASLTTPEKEIWVNLSPFEKNRIIPPAFGNTLMGQNLLAQDYILKQIMSTALYPEKELGHKFWQKIYTQAKEKYGTTNFPFSTFNKVWIVPNKAVVHENMKMNAVFVVESSLKVMLEKDYLAQTRHSKDHLAQTRHSKNYLANSHSERSEESKGVLISFANSQDDRSHSVSFNVTKELIIPALEKEVNEGKNFAPLRQVYNSLILAKWYKDNLRNSLIAQGYVDRNKIKGIGSKDNHQVSKIYDQYLRAYRMGVFDFVKEEFDEASQRQIPRKYFSGGFMGAVHITKSPAMISGRFIFRALMVSLVLASAGTFAAVTSAQAQTPEINAHTFGLSTGRTLTARDISHYLSVIEGAADGRGNATEAAIAYRSLPYSSTAMEAARKTLNLYANPKSMWDQALKDLPSNSALAPGYTIPGGASAQVGISNSGVIESIQALFQSALESRNAGNSTLRLEAALYLLRYADKIPSSGFFETFFQNGGWESLSTRNEPDDTVKAARLLVQAAMIKAGKQSREIMSGVAIVNLDSVANDLYSKSWMVRMAALAVFDAIKPNDWDNRYQGYFARFLSNPPPDLDIVTLQLASKIAINKKMITVLPSIMHIMEGYFDVSKRPMDPVAARNWHANMRLLMQQMIQLSAPHRGMLLANLNAMSDHLTAQGSTDIFNSYYIGALYALVQSGEVSKRDFGLELNKIRKANNLPEINVDSLIIEKQTQDLGKAFMELFDGRNVEANVNIIIHQGGPMYFLDLLQIFQETDNPVAVKAIIGKLDEITALGIYPRINPWTLAISKVMEDTGNPARIKMVLEGLSQSKTHSRANLMAIIKFLFNLKNPALNEVNAQQMAAYKEFVVLSARVIVQSGLNDRELNTFYSANTVLDNTNSTMVLLQKAIEAIRAGNDPKAVLDLDWTNAEKLFVSFLQGDDIDPKRVASAIEQAADLYRLPSGAGSGNELLERIVSNKIHLNAADYLKMAEVMANFKDSDFKFKWLSKLLGQFTQVDEKILGMFKADASNEQVARAAHEIMAAYLSAFDHRNLDNPDSLRTEARLRSIVFDLRADLAKEINLRINSSTDSQRRALLGFIGSTAYEPTEAYVEALIIVLNPNMGDDPLRTTLGLMSRMVFPSTAIDDLNFALKLPKFNNPDYQRRLIEVIAVAQKQIGPSLVAGDTYQRYRDRFLKAFEDAQSVETQASAIELFLTAPKEIAGDLFWESLGRLKTRYAQFAVDEQQRADFFDVLKTMRDVIVNLKKTDLPKYTAIVNHLKSNLEEQSRTRRFGNGIEYVFVRSIDADLVSDIDLGIEFVKDDHFLTSPNQPIITMASGAKQITSTYAVLASRLTSIMAQIGSMPPDRDILVDLESLFNPSDQVRQLAAMKNLGTLTVLFQNQIASQGDARMYLLYHLNQFRVAGNNSQVLFANQADFSEMERILYIGQLAKRGSFAWNQVRQFLQDDDLLAHHPEAVNELVDEIGFFGKPDMVEALLHLYVDKALYPNSVFGLGLSSSYIGSSIETALVRMGQREKVNVKARISTFKAALPAGLANSTVVGPLLDGIAGQIDHAMINGGIDLRNTKVQDQNRGDIRIAFVDPTQLAILIQCDGLVPFVGEIKPLSQTIINQLAGI